jgi:hypothetical protein
VAAVENMNDESDRLENCPLYVGEADSLVAVDVKSDGLEDCNARAVDTAPEEVAGEE